ncbi:MAG: hypothetical protein LBJ00_12720 [Planctomycetaceae bacterium]|nr:hypothetical protein [Planctomycetaceae bacterium]
MSVYLAGKAIGFALEQPLHVVTLACPASGILKLLECNIAKLGKRNNLPQSRNTIFQFSNPRIETQ